MRTEDETPDVPPDDDPAEASPEARPRRPGPGAGEREGDEAEADAALDVDEPEAEAEPEGEEPDDGEPRGRSPAGRSPARTSPRKGGARRDEPGEGEPEDEGPEDEEPDEAEAADPGETVEAETLVSRRPRGGRGGGDGGRAGADRRTRCRAGAPARCDAGRRWAEAEAEAEEPPAEETPAAVVPAPEDGDGKVPRAKPLWARLAASLVIVVSMAAATSISLLVYLTDIAEGLSDNDALASLRDQLTEVDGGAPQTILILGSDKRLNTKGDPGRSDTTILLRVDPDQEAIALLSIPRDLGSRSRSSAWPSSTRPTRWVGPN